MKRDRTKPKHLALKCAIEAVLSNPEQMSILATASIAPDAAGVWWDEDGPQFDDAADWDEQVRNVEMQLRSLLTMLARIPSGKKKSGGQNLPGEPDLTEFDWKILGLAREYRTRTGKAAANGAQGQNINNQGGPFIREAAAKLKVTEKALNNRIDRFEKHPRLKALWDSARDPNSAEKAFGHLRGLGYFD